jgi:hypothetical protein
LATLSNVYRFGNGGKLQSTGSAKTIANNIINRKDRKSRATRQKTKEKETHSVERQATQARGCSVAMLTNVT